jgi:membrane-associated phospholipid phosphatase
VGINEMLFSILIGWFCIEIISASIKALYHKKRPNGQTYSNIVEKIDAGSFPSIHSARSSFLFLCLFSIYPGNLRFIFLGLFLIVGLSRILLKKHYFNDVIGGYILGIIVFLFWRGIVL